MVEAPAWIPMSDGARLAATLLVPDDGRPAPAIVEANPYRKDDVTASYFSEYRRLRDEAGYAVVRIDIRGTGSSDGIATDEYAEQEQKDLCEAIAWIAEQEWCDGAVGMYGSSYSGFNAIQVAMERPPALKAIVAIYATDDRYTDDVHYAGGIRHALDFVDYPTYMVALNALPGVPALVGEKFDDEWRERVEGLEPWVLRWLEEQVDGPYWRHGSLRPGYERIQAATMIVGGFADGYRNATFRMFERLACPKRLLLGPWSHVSTETSLPGPRVDSVPEMVRWWDRWLRGRPSDIDDEPAIQVFVRRPARPAPDLDKYGGEWRYESAWPLAAGAEHTLQLGEAATRRRDGGRADRLDIRPDVGVCAPFEGAGHLPFAQPVDQRPDEVYSLVYDWPIESHELVALGYPVARLRVRSSAPVAFLAAKLCDVFPDGTSALVTRGVLNLTHRDSHADPSPLEPGRAYDVMIELDATSWIFEPGHTIRLGVAGTDWPNVWSPPEALALEVEGSASTLTIPLAPPVPANARRPQFRPSTTAPAGGAHAEGRSGARGAVDEKEEPKWLTTHDELARETTVSISHGSTTVVDRGVCVERYRGSVTTSTVDPGAARAEGFASFVLQWPSVTAAAEVTSRLESDAAAWHVDLELRVTRDGNAQWTRRWNRRFPRRLA